MLDARVEVRRKRAVRAEQLLAHALDRRRTVYFQLGNAVGALVPARHEETHQIEAMVVVQMAEKHVRHIDRALAGFEQPVVRARTVVHDDDVGTDFDEVAGTRALQRRRRRARA